MPPASTTLFAVGTAFALLLSCTACTEQADGLSQQALSSAMPTPADLPGGTWSVVGTTHTRPATTTAVDELAGARGTSARCRSALDGLAGATPTPSGFVRTVLRTTGPGRSDSRNLTLSVETSAGAPDRPGRITAAAAACTDTMSARVGKSDVSMTLRPQEYALSGATGYSVTYRSQGLSESYDEVAAVHGHTLVTASTSGANRADNRRVLEAAVKTALARLDAARQA